jgi:dipeptidyl aminopeptidase/acylaminoacyl peptidase
VLVNCGWKSGTPMEPFLFAPCGSSGTGPPATASIRAGSEWKALGRELSPILHVTPNLPPILIVHGDADTLVPLDQSQRFVERAEAVGRPVRLEVRPGKKHGWPTMVFDILRFANWFDEHLAPGEKSVQ